MRIADSVCKSVFILKRESAIRNPHSEIHKEVIILLNKEQKTVETSPPAQKLVLQRGLTVRSVVITLFALLLMGIWIEYEECFVSGGPLAENSPPNGAIGIMLLLLLISGLLYRFRRSFGLVTAELVVVYCALLVAAPLMTQGMWHRMFGLLAAIPHNQDFKSYESLPSMLWPHGPNLVKDPHFSHGLSDYRYTGPGMPTYQKIEWQGKQWDCPVISAGSDASARAEVLYSLPRYDASGREILVPGEHFLLSLLIKASGCQSISSYYINTRADDGRPVNIFRGTSASTPTLALPGGFQRIGVCPLTIPQELKERLSLAIGITGPGTLALQDLQFINVEAVEGLYNGRKVVQQRHWNQLTKHNEYDFTLAKPDNMWSLAGLNYLVHGFIPVRQWLQPMFAWSLLIASLFLGILGFNVLMRRQWAENERFTFPMNIIPRQLLGGDTSIFSNLRTNKVMWWGFAITLLLALLKGINFYYPAVPAPNVDLQLNNYVTDPLLRAYLGHVNISVTFCLLAVALLVETDILFSIWSAFLIFQLFFLFGKAFSFNHFAGYPWEWQQGIGSFIAFAVLAIFAARRHLLQVFRKIFGMHTELSDSQEIFSYRAALFCMILSVLLLAAWGAWTKMGPAVSLLFFGWMLLCGFTASKIRAEAGMPFGYWMPYFGMLFVSAMGGFAVFGATGMLVATIASGFMCVSCFLFIAPVQVEMMELGRFFKVRPRDIGYGLFIGLLGGLFIGGFVLLCWAYGFGGQNFTYTWPYEQNWYFNGFRMAESTADNALKAGHLITGENAPLNFITNADAKGLGIGFLITCLLAALRSLFMWFPWHPLGYVLATTHFARGMWFMAFLAWFARVIVFRVGGAHTIRRGLVPLCVGLLLACVVSIVLFDIVGIYLHAHGVAVVYSKWP